MDTDEAIPEEESGAAEPTIPVEEPTKSVDSTDEINVTVSSSAGDTAIGEMVEDEMAEEILEDEMGEKMSGGEEMEAKKILPASEHSSSGYGENDFLETGSFIRVNIADMFKFDRQLLDPPGFEAVRIVPDRNGLFSDYRTIIPTSLQPSSPLDKPKGTLDFAQHFVINKHGSKVLLQQVQQMNQLLLFIFCTYTNISAEFLNPLKKFHEELSVLPQIIEFILCPLDAKHEKARENYFQHGDYFTLPPSSMFMWTLKFLYDVTDPTPCTIVIKSTGELISRYPLVDYEKYGVKVIDKWLS